MKDIIVNWVKEDEELLEPYEWDEDDDLEIISRVDIYHVDEKTLHDFIYGCINIYDSQYFNNIFIVGDGKYSVVVEINNNGKLVYRSLTMMKQRTLINHELKKLPIVKINYHMYDLTAKHIIMCLLLHLQQKHRSFLQIRLGQRRQLRILLAHIRPTMKEEIISVRW